MPPPHPETRARGLRSHRQGTVVSGPSRKSWKERRRVPSPFHTLVPRIAWVYGATAAGWVPSGESVASGCFQLQITDTSNLPELKPSGSLGASHPRTAPREAAPPLANPTARRRHRAPGFFSPRPSAPPNGLPRGLREAATPSARRCKRAPPFWGSLPDRAPLPEGATPYWPALSHVPSPKPITTKVSMTHLHGPEAQALAARLPEKRSPRCAGAVGQGDWSGVAASGGRCHDLFHLQITGASPNTC